MIVVGGLIGVDLVENPLQRRGRDTVDHIDKRVGLVRPHLLDNLLGQAVELLRAVFEQRIDGDLAVELAQIEASAGSSAADPARSAGVPASSSVRPVVTRPGQAVLLIEGVERPVTGPSKLPVSGPSNPLRAAGASNAPVTGPSKPPVSGPSKPLVTGLSNSPVTGPSKAPVTGPS